MICIISDTHGDYSRFSHKKIKRLGKNDFLIICGDFGFVWDGSPKELSVLKKIGSKKYTTLFITGSHDNYDLLDSCPETDFCGGRARIVSKRLYMLKSGYIFNIDGHSLFAFGGGGSDADIIAESTEKQEHTYESDFELGIRHLEEADNIIDYIITHEPPASIAQFLDNSIAAEISLNSLNIYFDKIKGNVVFKMWFFGKLHRNKLVPPRYMAVFDEPYIIE